MKKIWFALIALLFVFWPSSLSAQVSDLVASGTITSTTCPGTGCLDLTIERKGSVAYSLTGTWTATVQARISVDGGTTFTAVDSYDIAGEKVVISTTANGQFAVPDVAGVSTVRIIATAFTSGSVSVIIRASTAPQARINDFQGVPGTAKPNHAAMIGGDDTTNLVTFGTTSAANLTASTNTKALIGEKGARWQAVSNPAAGSQATASKAAGGVGVRNVADCVSFSAASTVAPALTALTINLRDGASGVGTIIWTHQVAISASTGQNVSPFSVCGLNLIGTGNTAMTLEFSAALANLIESVSVSGYAVQ